MQYIEDLKRIGISFGYLIGVLLVLTLLSTTFYYFNFMGNKVYEVLQFIIPIISFLTGGFVMGKHAKHNGWKEGLKLGFFTSILFLLFTFLGLQQKLLLPNLIYFIVIVVTITFGSMIGINYKKPE